MLFSVHVTTGRPTTRTSPRWREDRPVTGKGQTGQLADRHQPQPQAGDRAVTVSVRSPASATIHREREMTAISEPRTVGAAYQRRVPATSWSSG